MKTFIKCSMMLGLSIAFIGASFVPACAQNNKGLKNLPKALGKKPPLTGTAPVVVPVTPRVPPTLQGVAVPNFTAAANKALDNAVERAVVPQVTRTNTKNPSSTMEKSTTEIKDISLNIKQETENKMAEIKEGYRNYVLSKDWTSNIDFRILITSKTPNYLPVFGFDDIRDLEYDYGTGTIIVSYTRPNGSGWRLNMTKDFRKVIDYCDSLDKMFFTKSGKQLFVNVSVIKEYKSYGDALEKLYIQQHQLQRIKAIVNSEPIQYFIATRNMQIVTALNAVNNTAQPQTGVSHNLPQKQDSFNLPILPNVPQKK